MCGSFLSPKAPPMPVIKPPEPVRVDEKPEEMDSSVNKARQDERNRLRRLAGRKSTIATSNAGLTSSATTGKTSLGG